MLMQLGSVSFEMQPFNTHGYSVSSTTDYAAKPVVGARQPLEHVGEGESRVTLEGRMLPKNLGGLSELAEVQAMRVSGMAHFLMRGDGKPMGWFKIESVEENHSLLFADGVGQQVDFTISLLRTDKPSAASYVQSLLGLL